MKLRYIFTMLASLLMLAFTGCQEEEGRFLDEVKVSQSYIAIPAEGGSVEITVDAIDSWSIAGVPEWLTVSPASGSAGQTKVTFSAGAATATNEATLALNCAGVSQTLNVLQMTEKLEVPISTCNFVNTQGEDGVIYRVKGTVTSIANTQYGNWYLDDGTGVVYIYGTLYEGATQQFTKHGLEVGDIVTVEGPRKNYNGTIELVDVTVIEIEKSLIKVDAVEPETGILPIEGGEFKVTLTCKGDGVSVNVPEDAKSWLYVTGLSTSGSEAVVTFTATENPAGKRNTELEFVTVSGGVEYKAMTSVTQEGSIAEVSVADFLAASEGTALFKLTGKVKNLQASDYGNFDLVDATGSVYVYGLTATPVAKNDKSFPTLGIKEGDVVTLIGTRASYNGTAQVGGPAYYVSHVGHVESTVADFLAQPTAADKWYQLTGTIANLVNETYGNFDLVGEDGSSVYVYGLTVAPVAKNDKSFAQLGLKEGDVVTLIGTRAEYNGTAQVGGPAYYISHEEGSAPAPEYSIDGKQWLAEVEGMQVLFDLGVYEEGALVVALPTMDGSAFGLYMTGSYEVVPADATSGKIVFTQYDYEWDEFMAPVEIAYSALSENSVNISAESVFGVADAVPCTAVAEPFDIITEGTGGDQPSGEIANGEYWFIEPTTQKVMTALGETQNYGRPASADAVNGASTAKNAYTFTYNPDWSCYTIQDSYGRYLYSSMQADGVTPYRTLSVSETVPSAEDENLAYYMWTVYNNGDGTYDVYNAATYYSITYSASYNNWEIYDPYEDDFANLFPALVKADNPVEEEPETPAGTTLTLTNAEICAVMTSSETSYSEYTIESASGVWTVNASRNKDNTFLQCRGKKGAYIKTPEFDKDIKSVTLHFTDKKSVYANNVYCAFPSTWTAPTADAAYPEDGNVGRAVTDGSYSITIPVEEGNKQVYVSIIGTYAYYVDHIDVAF
jgi:DNA/RNA endonuclease YhcR with UshA esterase domain